MKIETLYKRFWVDGIAFDMFGAKVDNSIFRDTIKVEPRKILCGSLYFIEGAKIIHMVFCVFFIPREVR